MKALEKEEPQLILAPQKQVALVPQAVTPMDLLQMALSNHAAIDVIERLSALQKEAMEQEATIAFSDAMNRAQASLGRVSADATNPQTKSKYATYAALDREVRPVYTKEGFSLSFDTEPPSEPEKVRVICYVSHRAGHTRKYALEMAADGKGAKGGDVMTKTHATGAAMSYGMRYLLKMIFNIAVGDADTDGNLTNGDMVEQLEWIANAKDMAELQRLFAQAYKKANGSKGAQSAVIAAKDKRKAELA